MSTAAARLLAVPLALVAAVPASAQDETVELRQITVQIAAGTPAPQRKVRLRDFSRALDTLHSCDGVEAVARRVKGEVMTRAQVPLRLIPPVLRDQLAGKPAGTVTHVFGGQNFGEAGAYRVLIRC